MGKLRAVFFDVDDTLYSTTEFAELARSNSVKEMIRLGLKMEHDEVVRELREVIAEFSSNFAYHFDKLLLRLPPEAIAGVNPVILIAGAIIAYHETKATQLRLPPEVKEVLAKLSKSDLILGIITSGPQVKQAEKILRLGLMEFMDPSAIFLSDQIGIGKPNVKLYMKACRQVNIWPLEAMYVGDNPPNDIDPPNQLGMSTVLVRRDGKYASVQGVTEPDHTIKSFSELLDILRDKYEVMIPDQA
jgi:putative hydrolase of the HAD superfamily